MKPLHYLLLVFVGFVYSNTKAEVPHSNLNVGSTSYWNMISGSDFNPALISFTNQKLQANGLYTTKYNNAREGLNGFSNLKKNYGYNQITSNVVFSFKNDSSKNYLTLDGSFDQATTGEMSLRNTAVGLNLAYNILLSKKNNQNLSIGFKGFYSQTSLDPSYLYFQDQFDSYGAPIYNGKYSSIPPLSSADHANILSVSPVIFNNYTLGVLYNSRNFFGGISYKRLYSFNPLSASGPYLYKYRLINILLGYNIFTNKYLQSIGYLEWTKDYYNAYNIGHIFNYKNMHTLKTTIKMGNYYDGSFRFNSLDLQYGIKFLKKRFQVNAYYSYPLDYRLRLFGYSFGGKLICNIF